MVGACFMDLGWLISDLRFGGDDLGEVEEQCFSVFAGGEGERACIFGADGISGLHGGALGIDAAFDELEPGSATSLDVVGDALAFRQTHTVDVGILMDRRAAFATIGRDNEHFGIVFLRWIGVPLRVAGREAALARTNPDLQERGPLGLRGIELAVRDATACTHELDLTGFEHAAIAHAVFVLQRTPQDVAKDFHVRVRMRGKACASSDDVLIDHTQAAEAHVRRIIVIGEGEGVVAIQPAVIGMAALVGFAKGEFHSGMSFRGRTARERQKESCLAEKLASLGFHDDTIFPHHRYLLQYRCGRKFMPRGNEVS
jgi:hypothetical protein